MFIFLGIAILVTSFVIALVTLIVEQKRIRIAGEKLVKESKEVIPDHSTVVSHQDASKRLAQLLEREKANEENVVQDTVRLFEGERGKISKDIDKIGLDAQKVNNNDDTLQEPFFWESAQSDAKNPLTSGVKKEKSPSGTIKISELVKNRQTNGPK